MRILADETVIRDSEGYRVVSTGLYALPNGDYRAVIVPHNPELIGAEWWEEMTGDLDEMSGHLSDLYRMLFNSGNYVAQTVTEIYA